VRARACVRVCVCVCVCVCVSQWAAMVSLALQTTRRSHVGADSTSEPGTADARGAVTVATFRTRRATELSKPNRNTCRPPHAEEHAFGYTAPCRCARACIAGKCCTAVLRVSRWPAGWHVSVRESSKWRSDNVKEERERAKAEQQEHHNANTPAAHISLTLMTALPTARKAPFARRANTHIPQNARA
jgi:hypothetical protein